MTRGKGSFRQCIVVACAVFMATDTSLQRGKSIGQDAAPYKRSSPKRWARQAGYWSAINAALCGYTVTIPSHTSRRHGKLPLVLWTLRDHTWSTSPLLSLWQPRKSSANLHTMLHTATEIRILEVLYECARNLPQARISLATKSLIQLASR